MKTTLSKIAAAVTSITMLALPLAYPLSAGASSSLFADGFQSSPNAYSAWTSGNPDSAHWGTDAAGHTGQSAKVVGPTSASKYLSEATSTLGYQNLSLTFWYKANSLAPGFFGIGADSVTVDYTTNGASWSNLATITASNDTSNWTSKTISLPAGASNSAGFKFRFDANLSGPQGFGKNTTTPTFWLDDVALSGNAIAATTSPATTTPPIITPPATTTPPVVTPAGTSTLTIITHVDNSNGTGTAVANDFSSTVLETIGTSTPFQIAGSPFEGNEFGTVAVLDDGSAYSVTESANSGYTTTLDDGCSGTAVLGTDITCSITNSDIAAPASGGSGDSGSSGSTDTSGSTSGGGGGYGGGILTGNASYGYVNTNPTGGVVLGTSTEATGPDQALPAGCSALLTSYLGMGKNDSSAQVKLLQSFLNANMGAGIPVTGVFGPMTKQAVMTYQVRHWQTVLAPWVPFGLKTDHTPTGYVYKTTEYSINLNNCSTLNIPPPQLP